MKALRSRIKEALGDSSLKVPVVIQLEALECGAACLDMILAFYGKWIPLEQARADCGVSRDGSNARNILKAARAYGLTAKGYRFEPEALRRQGHFPCIIHWNFNHFVVLCGFRGDKAILNDPAKGRYAVSMNDFDEAFTGICLMMSPCENFVPSGKPKSVAQFARKKLVGTGAAFALVFIATVVASLLAIISAGLNNVFYDRLMTGRNPEWITPFFAFVICLTLVQVLVVWIQSYYSLKANGKIAISADAEYMWHVLRLPMEFFSQRMAGDISSRKALNSTIAKTLIGTLAPLAINAIMMAFYLVVMVRYSLTLSLVGLFSVLIDLVSSGYISSLRVNLTRVMSRDEGKLSGSTVAGIEMIESIKASGAENGFFEKWAGYQAAVNAGRAKFSKINTYIGMFPKMISSLTSVAVTMGGVYLCLQGEWTVGMITTFSSFLTSFMAPAAQLVTASQTYQEMRTDMERVEDVLEYPTDVQYPKRKPETASYSKLSGKIELKNVTFGYSKLDAPLIENFSMTVEAGSRVALVGASGCGKSTLTKLISGLYKPWSGEILFDGKPISDIDRNVFVSSVAVVDQEIILFEDTIANNIKMWDSSIEDFEMILAARDAQLHEDIMRREGGYQGKLTEGGSDLSGGQRQRMEIARVLAIDPRIVIMDEATSALDTKTEYDVVRSIRDRGTTCVVVAHRLSTIRDCDEIIVMDKGRVIERGKHEELYKMGGLYARLVSNE